MSKPTSSRAEIRREIARLLGMEFFRRHESYSVASTGSAVGTFRDTTKSQENDYWNNMWLYITGDTASTGNIGQMRHITDFSSTGNKFTLEADLPSAPTVTATQYEVYNIFNPLELHQAINRAISEAFPAFFDIVTDETLIVKEDTLDYSLASLTNKPWIISSVWIEQPDESMTGTATAGAVGYLTDTNADFTGVDSTWLISIYAGTGAGQLRSVATLTGTTRVNPSAVFTTAPDTTSKYRVWNPAEQSQKWYRVYAFHTDAGEHPSTLYLTRAYSSVYGARIRLVYGCQASEITSETATTVVPKEYVICRAIEMLASSRISNARSDRDKWMVMEQIYRQKAEEYRQRNSFHMPTTIQQEYDWSVPSSNNQDNPLDW
jgi:hypothetical protein